MKTVVCQGPEQFSVRNGFYRQDTCVTDFKSPGDPYTIWMRVKGWAGVGRTRMSAGRPSGFLTESTTNIDQMDESVRRAGCDRAALCRLSYHNSIPPFSFCAIECRVNARDQLLGR